MEEKVVFESEEEAREVIKTIFGTNFTFLENDGKIYIDRLKGSGYIRKSAVEEAEEMWDKMGDRKISVLEYKQREAIQEQHIKLSEKNRIIAKLEDENERLKK